jgi:hypothetical protein
VMWWHIEGDLEASRTWFISKGRDLYSGWSDLLLKRDASEIDMRLAQNRSYKTVPFRTSRNTRLRYEYVLLIT